MDVSIKVGATCIGSVEKMDDVSTICCDEINNPCGHTGPRVMNVYVRTYAFFAVGSQPESRGAEALVGALSIDAGSLASAVVNRALVHICFLEVFLNLFIFQNKQKRRTVTINIYRETDRWIIEYIHAVLNPSAQPLFIFVCRGERKKRKKTISGGRPRSISGGWYRETMSMLDNNWYPRPYGMRFTGDLEIHFPAPLNREAESTGAPQQFSFLLFFCNQIHYTIRLGFSFSRQV